MKSESLKNLEELLEEGFEIVRAPMTDFEPAKGAKYALPLYNLSNSDKRMLCFNDEDTNKRATEIVNTREVNPFDVFKGASAEEVS